MISWWRTSFDGDETRLVADSIANENVSQGKVTKQFEDALSTYLGVEHVIAVSSGSTALLMALMALDVQPGDEVIVPDRTWIATAHAARLLGAQVVVDVEPNRPIIDAEKIEAVITPRTKVIMPVHMNGRSADMERINMIAHRHKVAVVEDAAQAFGSRNKNGFLGTQSTIGCFSLSVAKTISTGQGGYAVTNDGSVANKLRAIRTHGVENVKDPESWPMLGFNFRFTDVLASIGIAQLARAADRIDHLRNLYSHYETRLRDSALTCIPVNVDAGEVPVYVEYLVNDNRQSWIDYLQDQNIETRPFYPNVSRAPYLNQHSKAFPEAQKYGDRGLYLPSGPSQSLANAEIAITAVLGRN